MSPRPVRAIVAAGGSGERFGPTTPKLMVEVAGRSVLQWSIARLTERATEVLVAAPASRVEAFARHLDAWPQVRVVEGGRSRWRSVRRAFDHLSAEPDDLVAVHDAARPALAPSDLARVLGSADRTGAAVLGRAVSDTVKRLDGRRIDSTVDRRELFRAETPQVFLHRLLERAFEEAENRSGQEPTDDSSLVERLGDVPIEAVEAEHPNPKLTVPGDLELLEPLLRRLEPIGTTT